MEFFPKTNGRRPSVIPTPSRSTPKNSFRTVHSGSWAGMAIHFILQYISSIKSVAFGVSGTEHRKKNEFTAEMPWSVSFVPGKIPSYTMNFLQTHLEISGVSPMLFFVPVPISRWRKKVPSLSPPEAAAMRLDTSWKLRFRSGNCSATGTSVRLNREIHSV